MWIRSSTSCAVSIRSRCRRRCPTLFGADDPLFVLPAAAHPKTSLTRGGSWRRDWARPESRGSCSTLSSRICRTVRLGAGLAATVSPRRSRAGVADQGVEVGRRGRRSAEEACPSTDHSLVLVAEPSSRPGAGAVGWVAASPVAAIPGLARKLPHYTQVLLPRFPGDEPDNVAKGMWRPSGSPLVRNLVDRPDGGPRAARSASRWPSCRRPSTRQPLADGRRCSPTRRSRVAGSAATASSEATAWVENGCAEVGLEPAGDDGFRQTWSWTGGEPEREMELVNLVGRVPGSDPDLADQPVLVMAHLDHLGRVGRTCVPGNEGEVHPGADDNASGVAVLLELARTMAAEPPRPRPVVFAVVTGEEAGSRSARATCWSSMRRRSRRSPASISTRSGVWPTASSTCSTPTRRASGGSSSWGWATPPGAPVAVVPEPLDASDQVACIERGVPAVQLFTGPTRGLPPARPTPSTRSTAEGMVVVTEAAHEAVAYLAERAEPLTVTIAAAGNGWRRADRAARERTAGQPRDHAGLRIRGRGSAGPAGHAGLGGRGGGHPGRRRDRGYRRRGCGDSSFLSALSRAGRQATRFD